MSSDGRFGDWKAWFLDAGSCAMGTCIAMALMAGTALAQAPAGRVGRAVVAAMTPAVEARYPDKTVHDYPQGKLDVREGMALSELHQLTTDKHGRACLVLTPGAMVCVRPQTSVRLDRLEQMTEGIPTSTKELQRRIELTVNNGAILIHAGPPSANLSIRVSLPQASILASGGEFVVMQEPEGWVVGAYRASVTVTAAGASQVLAEGACLLVSSGPGGKVALRPLEGSVARYRDRFDMCQEFFPELDRLVFLPDGVDSGRLQAWIGTPGGLMPVGDPVIWGDVTPSMRLATRPLPQMMPSVPGRPDASGRRDREWVWQWYRNAGVIKGVNYIPRTAVNAVEFWEEKTFDADTIAEELRWANQAGFNSVRVMMSYAVWAKDPDGFKQRLRRFLELADRHGQKVVPVLFDDLDIAGRDPAPGAQPAPVPGVHNSQWVPNPGRSVLESRAQQEGLERYVRDLTGTFNRDGRVLFWDLYNVPGYGAIGDKSLGLLESAFRWARESRVRQPVTAVAWGDAASPISSRLMELSDIITLQSFEEPALLEMRLRACEAYKRPVICSGWLKRQKGSTFEAILPVLSDRNVGWYAWGLVKGKAQFYIPEERRQEGGKEPETWQQDVLWPDGKPYARRELELIKAFKFKE